MAAEAAPPGPLRATLRRWPQGGGALALGDHPLLGGRRGPSPAGSRARRKPPGGRGADALRPGPGRARRPRAPLPVAVHRPRPARGRGPARPDHAGGTRGARDDRPGGARRPGRGRHAVLPRHARSDLRRQGRRLPDRRRPRRRKEPGREPASRPAQGDGGPGGRVEARQSEGVARLDGGSASQFRSQDRQRRRRALRRDARPAPDADPAAARLRRRRRRGAAARRGRPRDRALARRRRLPRAVLHHLHPDPEPVLDDRPRARHRLRAADREPLSRVPLPRGSPPAPPPRRPRGAQAGRSCSRPSPFRSALPRCS